MSSNRNKNSFWLSYSDLMTSLFFIMFVLFVICVAQMKVDNEKLRAAKEQLEKLLQLEEQLNNALEDANASQKQLEEALKEAKDANASKEQLEKLLQLEEQFKELSNSSVLAYDEEKKMFYAKDFIGVEIFEPNKDVILQKFRGKVDEVGISLQEVVKRLHQANPELNFQLVIEGTAAIPWRELKAKTFNPDNRAIYELSYKRALALYYRWRVKGINLRQYNTEIIIAGSGFNGINRDEIVEENNKRFIIQIIPKISRPQNNTQKNNDF